MFSFITTSNSHEQVLTHYIIHPDSLIYDDGAFLSVRLREEVWLLQFNNSTRIRFDCVHACHRSAYKQFNQIRIISFRSDRSITRTQWPDDDNSAFNSG